MIYPNAPTTYPYSTQDARPGEALALAAALLLLGAAHAQVTPTPALQFRSADIAQDLSGAVTSWPAGTDFTHVSLAFPRCSSLFSSHIILAVPLSLCSLQLSLPE